MPMTYRGSVMLADASVLRPGEIDRLNKILQDAGLGHPLRRPAAGNAAPGDAGLVVLPVTGADPMAVRDVLHAVVGQSGEGLHGLTPDIQYGVATAPDGARDAVLFASGKKSGHGTIAWLPAPSYLMPDPPPWRARPRRPVIALLDSGVQPHDWLPEPADGQQFVIDAAQEYGWKAAVPVGEPPPDLPFGSHWGHATFIAGLIRLAAPDAQVLSLQVMSSMGKVSEKNVIAALDWLAGHIEGGGTVDAVLMAFGRQADSEDGELKGVRKAIRRLSRLGVTIVASAGNQNSERPVYPAAFATDSRLSVVSAGARISATERAPYSDYGVWVQQWREGTNILSIMPLTTKDTTGNGYAWWNGTSFAAATYAGELARKERASQTSPAPAAGS